MQSTNKNISISVITESFKKIDSLYDIKLFFKSLFRKKRFTGHSAVTRSLCEGLNELNVTFNYNPSFQFQINKYVIVLSDIEALRHCIKLKEKGVIKKLLAGPNLVVRSNEYNNLLGNDNIDLVIVPSEWVKQAYVEDLPVIKDRVRVWAAGINTSFFSQPEKKDSNRILIYWKNVNEEEVGMDNITQIIKLAGFECCCIKYGSYTIDDFKKELQNAKAVIYLSNSESQGLALQEIWSMDVPTFVWQPDSLAIGGKIYSSFSSAPYLTSETGMFFKNIGEIENILTEFKKQHYVFNPRKTVLDKFTDAVCTHHLLHIFEETNDSQNKQK